MCPYLEYAQETQQEQMELKEVTDRLHRRITTKFKTVHQARKRKKIAHARHGHGSCARVPSPTPSMPKAPFHDLCSIELLAVG